MRPIHFNFCFGFCLVGTALMTIKPALGQVSTQWTNASGGSFHEDDNWSVRSPLPLDFALFELPDTYTVHFSADVSNQQLAALDGQATLNLLTDNNTLLTYTLISTDVASVLVDADAVLKLNGGKIQSIDTIIGQQSNQTATAIATGAQSTWGASGRMVIGSTGKGQLSVLDGGTAGGVTIAIGDASTGVGAASVDGTASLLGGASNFYIGNAGNGTLHLTQGGRTTSGVLYVGHAAFSTGLATVDDQNSNIDNGSILYVGDAGNGELQITGGGTVTTPEGIIGDDTGLAPVGDDTFALYVSHGVVTVDGEGSAWTSTGQFIVGNQGHGEMTIQDGGDVSNGQGYIGYDDLNNAGSGTGIVTVTGEGSTWTNTVNLHVGEYGNGTLNVTNGGVVTSDEGYVGDSYDGGAGLIGSSGVVTIDGKHSRWSSTGQLVVGNFGHGELTIQNGGSVTAGYAIIGRAADAGNKVVVQDEGSSFSTTDYLEVNHGANLGTLEIHPGATVTVGGTLYIDNTLGDSGGAVALYGGTIHAGQVSNEGHFYGFFSEGDVFGDFTNDGDVTITYGANDTFHNDVVQNGTFTVTKSGIVVSSVTFLGDFSGGGITGGGDVHFEGSLKPGNSPGIVQFDNNVFLGDNAHTIIELAGTSEGNHQFDRIIVNGQLTLAGVLDVVLYDDFTPQDGNLFNIFDWDSVQGQFGQVILPDLRPGLRWDTSGLYSVGELRVTVPEPAAMELLAFGILGLLMRRRKQGGQCPPPAGRSRPSWVRCSEPTA